jgi:streptogramin lyase
VYVSGYWSHNVLKVTPGGTVTEIIDESGDGGGNDLQNPRGIVVDDAGNIFVAGQGSNNVFKIRPSGTITEIIDYTGDGAGNSLFDPFDLVTDEAGSVYVSTDFSRNVLRFDPDSTITMIISSTGDGLGNGLGGARALAIDAYGNVFVAGKDSDNAFRITLDGTITEIIDAAGSPNPLDELNDARGIATDDKGNVFVSSRLTSSLFRIDTRAEVTPSLYLEGAYTGGGLMSTALNPELPLAQPFSPEPWMYTGNESVSSMPGNVVDWLLVEIRTDTAAATTVARQAVLLLEDGGVVDTSGTERPRFIHPGRDSVFVVIRHRNHLDIMSIDKVDLTVAPVAVNFTTAESAFGTDPLKHIPGAGYALYACDIRADDVVNSLDMADFEGQTSDGAEGYQPADVNADGMVQAIDFIPCLENLLNAATSQVP